MGLDKECIVAIVKATYEACQQQLKREVLAEVEARMKPVAAPACPSCADAGELIITLRELNQTLRLRVAQLERADGAHRAYIDYLRNR